MKKITLLILAAALFAPVVARPAGPLANSKSKSSTVGAGTNGATARVAPPQVAQVAR
jgi:hypothetical protein